MVDATQPKGESDAGQASAGSDAAAQPSVVSPLSTHPVARARPGSALFNRLELAPPFVFSA